MGQPSFHEGRPALFSLNPHSKPSPAVLAQWATIDQNWNSMCADCHSTNVRKNYDWSRRTYDTTNAEVDVGCEACHGPGSAHVAWARLPSDRRARDPSHGLTVSFGQRLGIGWRFDSESGEVRGSRAPSDDREVETCARCHSRRTEIHEDYVHSQSLGDDYRVALLDDGLSSPMDRFRAKSTSTGHLFRVGCSMKALVAAIVMILTACACGQKETAFAPDAISPPDTIRRGITFTQPDRPARDALIATCLPVPTCSSIGDVITAFACRGRTYRSRLALRTPATIAIPTRIRVGQRGR